MLKQTSLTDNLQALKIASLILSAVLLIVVMSLYLPGSHDWNGVYRPASRALLSGQSPYGIEGYLNPPWTLLPLIPLALLPESVGRSALLVLSLGAFMFTALRLDANRVSLAFFMLSPPVLHSILSANVDSLTMLGFVLPPQIGLFFLATKPQIGFAVAIYWLIDIWRTQGLMEVIKTFWPITVALLGSFLLFGLWPLRFQQQVDVYWNSSLWPASIPIGLALLVSAIKKRNYKFAMGASPCLSPYLLLQSWSGALVAVVAGVPETIAAVAGLWILVAMRAAAG